MNETPKPNKKRTGIIKTLLSLLSLLTTEATANINKQLNKELINLLD